MNPIHLLVSRFGAANIFEKTSPTPCKNPGGKSRLGDRAIGPLTQRHQQNATVMLASVTRVDAARREVLSGISARSN